VAEWVYVRRKRKRRRRRRRRDQESSTKEYGAEIKEGGGTSIARNMSIIVLRIWRWRLH
jgi:hypothetical protein